MYLPQNFFIFKKYLNIKEKKKHISYDKKAKLISDS